VQASLLPLQSLVTLFTKILRLEISLNGILIHEVVMSGSQSPAWCDSNKTSGDLGPEINEETALLPGTQPREDEPGSVNDHDEQESWNEPRINAYRFASVIFTLFNLGLNDACIGALIPYIQPYYDINYTVVSTLFVVPFLGYLVAALANSWIHLNIGQRGIAFCGPACRLISFIAMASHPKEFAYLPIAMALTGLGNGFNDSAWNAWVGNLRNQNELLGLIHGAYGLGGIVGPLIASAMVSKLGYQWYEYFYVMIGVSVLEIVWNTASFWTATAAEYRRRHKFGEGKEPTSTREILSSPVPWIVSAFLFGYVGIEVCLGGWIPSFMIEVRHSDKFLAGVVVTLFWAGLTLGRVVLGFVTGRIGEKLAIVIYLSICVVLEILYWAIPSLEVAIVCVIFMGFFLGPLFPAAIVTMTKLLPADQHVATIGLSAAIGGGGAAVFPFLVGLIAEDVGVQVLQPFVLVLMGIIMVLWIVLPGGFRKGGLEQARREGLRIGDVFRGST